MIMGDSEDIQAVLFQLGELTELISERVSMHEEMRELKVDIRSYVDDSRISIGLVKTDVGDLKIDVRGLQKSVDNLSEDMNTMRVELKPLVDMKKYISGQVVKYTGTGFLAVLSVLLGLNMLP
jgi:hypothetical protein